MLSSGAFKDVVTENCPESKLAEERSFPEPSDKIYLGLWKTLRIYDNKCYTAHLKKLRTRELTLTLIPA